MKIAAFLAVIYIFMALTEEPDAGRLRPVPVPQSAASSQSAYSGDYSETCNCLIPPNHGLYR